jgi:A118 family predicted phage portal protein
MKLSDFFIGLGYDITGLTSGFTKIGNNFNWYKGFVKKFHKYYVYNGEKRVYKDRYSLQISKKICENFADLLMNEKVNITLGNDENNKKLEKILNDNNFYVKANQGIEKTFALGTGAFLLSFEEAIKDESDIITDMGKPKIQFINAMNIYPLSFDENEISECAFTNYKTKVDPKTGTVIKILDLQIHLKNKETSNYIIMNYKFIENDNKELQEIPLVDVEKVIETNSPHRWFIPIKPNVINNIDLDSPFGISIFANALDNIKALDLTYDSLVNEIQNGRKRLFVSAEAMKVGFDGLKRAFDPEDILFHSLDAKFDDNSAGRYVQEINGQLRVDELTKAIQMHLNLLSMKLGLGDNYYKFDGNIVSKTATEVVSENSDLFRTLQKHKIILDSAIKELIETIGYFTNIKTNEEIIDEETGESHIVSTVKIDFDDSIIESK